MFSFLASECKVFRSTAVSGLDCILVIIGTVSTPEKTPVSILKDTCIIPYQRLSNRISFVRLSWCSLVNIITQNNYHNIHLTKFYDNHEHIKSIYEVTFKLSYIQFNYIQLNSFNKHMYKQYLLPLLHRIHKSLIFWWGGVINKHEYTDWT